jgi:predicted flap endonuclease-1-like 5' DNA nuclease
MLYLVGEIFVWMALAFVLGVAVGWFIWGYRYRAEAARARADCDRQLAALREQGDQARAQVQELIALRGRDAETITRLQAISSVTDPEVNAELRARIAVLESRLAASREERSEAEERAGAAEDILEHHGDWSPVGVIPGLEDAQTTLGKPVVIDDLKVVEGVGPAVEEVLHGARLEHAAAAQGHPRCRRPAVPHARSGHLAAASGARHRGPLGRAASPAGRAAGPAVAGRSSSAAAAWPRGDAGCAARASRAPAG